MSTLPLELDSVVVIVEIAGALQNCYDRLKVNDTKRGDWTQYQVVLH